MPTKNSGMNGIMKTGAQHLSLQSNLQYVKLLPALESLSIHVGTEIMRHYQMDLTIHHKPDGSPVTQADHDAEIIILHELSRLAPEITIIAEENFSQATANGDSLPDTSSGVFWLIDALDGTAEFLKHNEDFTVNIALIENNVPALGVIHHPASGVTYVGTMQTPAERIEKDGTRRIIHVSEIESPLRIVSSKSFGNEIRLEKYLSGRQIADHRYRSCSIKFCEVAEGTADLYPRFGPSREWDTAAGHAIVNAAGGSVITSAGEPLMYGKENFVNSEFIVRGKR
jgi:3'(2'), 5'-bisphosphate nucleotidase